jgi:hypothetical protein
MPHARKLAKLASMEAQIAPHGNPTLGTTPAWASQSVRERPTDAQWKRSFGDELSDEQFSAEWERRERAKVRR